MTGTIGVGVIGASPHRGWAARAHLPAIVASPQFTLAAVATTRKESAEAARAQFGARHAFTDAHALASSPDVDLVVVTVKVPAHVELVDAALDAGKHVYCEWPLSTTGAEASALAARAAAKGVRTAVGLQARFSPAVHRAREMIVEGRVGTVNSATVYSSRGKGSSPDIPDWTAYTYDRSNGAGLVEVLGGHALDLVQHLLGPIRDLSTRTAIRTPHHRIAETGERIAVTAADHFLAIAETDSSAMVSIHLHDGEPTAPRSRIEIAGTQGNLALISTPETNPWAAQLQISQFELYEAQPDRPEWSSVTVAMDGASMLSTEAASVARLYHQLAADFRDGTHTVPDFQVASALQRLIEQATLP